MRAELKGLIAGAVVVYLIAIWWGVPWLWAPDELGPGTIFNALDARFAGGWHDKYPPMQYYLGAIIYTPFLVAERFGGVDLTTYTMTVTLTILLRLLSVAMAAGTIPAIYLTASDLYGRRGAFAAALLAALTPIVVFYAKVGNVDVPSFFWFAWAIRFYVAFVRTADRRALIRFALTGVTAIATKDQTAGFFVLPACHVAWIAIRAGRWRSLVLVGALAGLVLVMEMGIPFNPRGFVEHVRMITGEASEPYRIRGTMWTRQLMVARLTAVQLAWSMTWLGLAVAVLGVLAELRRRRFLWLLLPAISYYVFFLVIAGYVYDRFLVGVGFILAIFAGGWVDGFLRPQASALRWRTALCAAGGLFVIWAGVSMDMMMVLDSRYEAERWIRSRRSEGYVAVLGPAPYLPHISGAHRLTVGPASFEPSTLPRFVVTNAELLRRESLPPVERVWRDWFNGGSSPYVVAARFKSLPAASLLSYMDVFANGVEDATTNLDKVAPEIVVYWKPGALR